MIFQEIKIRYCLKTAQRSVQWAAQRFSSSRSWFEIQNGFSKSGDSGAECEKIQTAPKPFKSPRPKYNYGLAGKGKSKRFKSSDLPPIQGEVLFGLHPVRLALSAGRRAKVYGLYVDTKFWDAGHNKTNNAAIFKMLGLEVDTNIPIHPVSRPLLDQLAGNRPHQGVCLDVDELEVPVWAEDMQLSRSPDQMALWLLLCNIQDPMNMGAVLRTAHFFGFHKVVVPYSNSCRLSPVVSKASAGAMEVIDVVRLSTDASEVDLCQWWQSRGWEVVGTAVEGPTGVTQKHVNLCDFSTSKPTMVLLGNEGSGLSQDLMRACDTLVTIPSYEHKQFSLPVESLNVSVAAGILLHWIKTSQARPR